MTGDKMDVEIAEQRMKSLEHSEQHYFKRLVVCHYPPGDESQRGRIQEEEKKNLKNKSKRIANPSSQL